MLISTNLNFTMSLVILYLFILCGCLIFSIASYWQSIENRRWIFIKYAKQAAFDPEVGPNWFPHIPNMFVHKVYHLI